MTVKTASEQMAGPIGRDLAWSDDHVQAEFFNAFAAEAWKWNAGGIHRETQVSFVTNKLDDKGRWFFREMAAFIALDEESPS